MDFLLGNVLPQLLHSVAMVTMLPGMSHSRSIMGVMGVLAGPGVGPLLLQLLDKLSQLGTGTVAAAVVLLTAAGITASCLMLEEGGAGRSSSSSSSTTTICSSSVEPSNCPILSIGSSSSSQVPSICGTLLSVLSIIMILLKTSSLPKFPFFSMFLVT